jgi:heterodisulfide reductase subunit A-like polyferredoxin
MFDEHAGQIVSLEDTLKIADLAENHVLQPCSCRRLVHGSIEMVCLGIGASRDLTRSYKPSEKIEPIDSEEAKARLREWDRRGLVHHVLYAKAPYPIGVCNCDQTYCTAFKTRFVFGIENMLMKGHEIAVVDQNRCDGCSSYGIPRCIHKCQFGALHWNRTENKATADSMTCFGCGVCRVACDKGAIRIVEREKIPVLRNRW